MSSLKPVSPRKKRHVHDTRQKRSSEKFVEDVVEDEADALAEQIALVETDDDNETAGSSSGSSISQISAPVFAKPAVARPKGYNKPNADPATEYYCRKAYRSVMNGEDIDTEKDEPEIYGASRQAAIIDSWKPEYSTGTQELAHPDHLPRTIVVDDGFVLKRKEAYSPPAKLVYCDDQANYYDSEFFEKEHARDPVHYEITAHDTMWIKKLNEHRPLANGQPYLTLDTFKKIMRALEIDTFKNIHNHLLDALHVVYIRYDDSALQEEQECDVCRMIDSETGEDMLFCDMCNTCVHCCCAGVLEYNEDKEFLCQKCRLTNNPAHPCVLCPALGGSMTYDETKTKWAHHSCALFTKEIKFGDAELRAPITGFDEIPKDKFNLLCCVCDTRQGACNTCSQPGCDVTFHVCCALRAGCSVNISSGVDPLVAFCHRHSSFINGRGPRLDAKYLESNSPWLAMVEDRFYLMTNYEKLAESLVIEEIIVSDVYEFWKQKRLKKRGPLIPHLHDHIRIQPIIDRVAQRSAMKLDHAYNKAGISMGILPASVPDNYFFRPAALMVTELRQKNLKRADDTFQRDVKMCEMIEEREMLKREEIQLDVEKIKFARRLFQDGCDESQITSVFQEVSEEEIKKARRSPRRKPAFYAKLAKLAALTSPPPIEVGMRPRVTSPMKRKCPPTHPHIPEKKSVGSPAVLQKSPLRPRNHHHQPPSAAPPVARNLKAGIQNSFAIPHLPARSRKNNKY